MNQKLRKEAEQIIYGAIRAVAPDRAVRKALEGKEFTGRTFVVSVGKAAWQMAKSASEALYQPYEAGHPIPDENSFLAMQAVLDMTADLKEDDTVLFLLSGGGSALFEKPLVSGAELRDITRQLLAKEADIIGDPLDMIASGPAYP